MTITTLDNGYTFVPRGDWGARHSAGRTVMPAQVTKIVLHHTVTRATDNPCADMAGVENVLNGRGLAPGYSFVVHPSGVVLEGAGSMKGAHTEGLNSQAYGISFIGNYDKESPTFAAIIAAARTVNMLRLAGKLPQNLADVEILLHRQTKSTACPGAHMMNIDGKSIAEWVRWFAGTGA